MSNIIDRALAQMRNTTATTEQVESAATRVLASLNAEHNKVVAMRPAADRIESCEDFQSLIPAYKSGSLTASKKLLFEDHIHECVACRNVSQGARRYASGSVQSANRRTRSAATGFTPYAAVAAAILLVVAFMQRDAIRDFISPIDVHAITQSVNGGLFRVSQQDIRGVAAGERIERRQPVRTGADSGAVLQLADGSRIEMNSRSEISLDRARDGVQIQLVRGSVIVTAAKQRQGHLYVATADCMVSVVGTVFSVSSGVKGSRVSVIEGEVHVQQQGSTEQALHPGQQVATNAAMGTVPVAEEISWSRDRDLHVAMLKEVGTFAQDLAQRIGAQEMRHSSNLLPLVPANTLVFISLPNVSQPLAESYGAMKQRIAENPSLQAWWNQNPGRSNRGFSIDEFVSRLTQLGAYLGPELIVSGNQFPVLLADVKSQPDLVAALNDLTRDASRIRIVQTSADLAALAADGADLVVYVDQKVLVVAPKARQIQSILEGGNGFQTNALYPRVTQAYASGVGWILAADLSQIAHGNLPPGLGADVQHFLLEQRTGSGGASYQAVLGFNKDRTGVAAWLASPGPIGATEFVSPNAYGAAAIVTKDPALILDDFFAMLQREPNGLEELKRFELEHHVDLRYDIASRLGNEFLIAVDGPILPTPAWKVVIEVNDAARLQNVIELAVTEINREASASGAAPLTSSMEVSGGRTFYALKSTAFPVEIHYTFWAGYMIVGPTRSLLEEAIQYHDTGTSLARSEHFRSQFPADGRDNASGFIYQNLQAVVNAIPVPQVKAVVGNSLPSMICLYGESDRITMSSKGVLGSNIASLAGLTGMMRAIGIK